MKKRFICVLTVVVITLGMVCFASGEDSLPVLTVSIPDNIKVEDFNTNDVTIYIEETLGRSYYSAFKCGKKTFIKKL